MLGKSDRKGRLVSSIIARKDAAPLDYVVKQLERFLPPDWPIESRFHPEEIFIKSAQGAWPDQQELSAPWPQIQQIANALGWKMKRLWFGTYFIPSLRREKPSKAYHLVPTARLSQVLSKGIFPSSPKRSLTTDPKYGDTTGKIYLMLHADQAEDIAWGLQNDATRKPIPYSLLEVDLTKVRTNKLHQDEMQAGMSYNFYITGVKIPPEALKHVKDIPILS